MRSSVLNVIEVLIGAILTCLGLIYLMTQYKALSKMTDMLNEKIIEDHKIIQQYNPNTEEHATHSEIIAAIIGYREYPIMVNNNLIPVDGKDYDLYFSYIRNGLYKKGYKFDDNRKITMIIFTSIST